MSKLLVGSLIATATVALAIVAKTTRPILRGSIGGTITHVGGKMNNEERTFELRGPITIPTGGHVELRIGWITLLDALRSAIRPKLVPIAWRLKR